MKVVLHFLYIFAALQTEIHTRMKKFLFVLTIISGIITISNPVSAKDRSRDETGKERIRFGYDGGMMLHTGYLLGTIPEISHQAEGMPFGIGGAIKFHLGKHFRIGSEGYVSTLKQLNNGSTIKFGWGGILADCRFDCGLLMPYFGVTVGGGARVSSLMLEGNISDWEKEESFIFNKQKFLAVAPFIGTDFVVTPKFHLTLKVDCLNAINKDGIILPTGPRIYFGFLMYH